MARRDAAPRIVPTAVFCFDDSKTETSGIGYFLQASVEFGCFYWMGKVPITMEGERYYLYQRNFLYPDPVMTYIRQDAGIFSSEGLLHDERTVRLIYAKYQLLTIL